MEKKLEELQNYSNPEIVQAKAEEYGYGDIYISTKPTKKYMIENPEGKWIHFGAFGMQDYTYHKDKKRRESYLKRATKIRGNWRNDKYSPNNLAIHLLW
jgi:hypothetical protein